MSNISEKTKSTHTITDKSSNQDSILHVIFGSRTGNSESAARLAYDYARHLGISAEIHNMHTMDPSLIKKMKNLLIAVSTHGEGDPPAVAENFYNYVHSPKADISDNVRFSILALGDSSYKDFCKTGHDFRKRLLDLGAKEISPMVECDIDYEEKARSWVRQVTESFEEVLPKSHLPGKKEFAFEINHTNTLDSNIFYAKVKELKTITHPDFHKRTMHLSLSMEKFAGDFQPGDSFGIYVRNSRLLVDKLLKFLKFDGSTTINTAQGSKLLKEALVQDFEITLITPLMIEKYASITKNKEIETLSNHQETGNKYCQTSDLLDLVTDYPGNITPQELIDLLRPLKPRLYSIANSPDVYPGEAHFTIGLIEYEQKGRSHTGVCSSLFSDRLDKGDSIAVFHEKNEKFRIPQDNSQPAIMICTSTGIAPFRGFLQKRNQLGATGENWLIFGDRHIQSDFLYRQELEKYLHSGLLTRMDTAFSRDQENKIYVQHRMQQHRNELFRWIDKKKAVVYLCGNKRTMGQSVKSALEAIISEQGNLNAEETTRYLELMKEDKRLQSDLY